MEVVLHLRQGEVGLLASGPVPAGGYVFHSMETQAGTHSCPLSGLGKAKAFCAKG